MCAWRVDQIVDHLNCSYLYKKRGVYYFTKRVPCDVKSYYKSDRIVICLRTKSNVSAIRSSKSLYQKLDDYWTSIRLTKMQVPAEHMLVSKPLINSNSNAPLLSEALSTYLRLKGEGKDKIFVRAANRNIKYVIEVLGNYIKITLKNISSYIPAPTASVTCCKSIFPDVSINKI